MDSRIGVGVGPRATEWGLAWRVAACACAVLGVERITTAAATPARSPTTSPAPLAGPAGCSFAQAGTGTFASTLCWLDLSAYNSTSASKPAGQPMTVTLPGGYTIRFNLHVSGGPVAATGFPTFVDAFLGDNDHESAASPPPPVPTSHPPPTPTPPHPPLFPVRPALNQTTRGTTTTATL